jgi:predicted dehydrogenase
MIRIAALILAGLLTVAMHSVGQQAGVTQKPLRVAVAGLSHDHAHMIMGRKMKGDIEIVGIAEPNRELAARYAKQYSFDLSLVYPSLEALLAKTKPEAVLAFNAIFDHLRVVELCAPLGIHVMVEKPLAVSWDHGQKMLALAKKHNIHLLTNYETTWYGSNATAYQLAVKEQKLGDLRKIVFHTGHPGPKEIGCSKEFLAWLTDPVQNGAGALNDFGCYGANLSTWLMQGEQPVAVTAVTQQIKPDVYPKVDDEATIIITYPKTQVIIQASWNWPYSRKDMELYGLTGYVFCKDAVNMQVRDNERTQAYEMKANGLSADIAEPFVYLAKVIRGEIKMSAYDLSAPANNEMVVKILEAAKVSARNGKSVIWKSYFK